MVSQECIKALTEKFGSSGMAYCRRAGINCKTFYYWQNVIQKELLASKTQYADVVDE